MSKKSKTDNAEVFEVQCSCECPNWGKEHEDVWAVKADGCGHEFTACGLCLREGRLTDCRICQKEPKPHHQQN